MNAHDRPLRGRLFFSIALACAWALTGLNLHTRLCRIDAATHVTVHQHPLPQLDPASATGYANGLRTKILPSGSDGMHWIMNAQRMAHEHLWRVRTMPQDNVPSGRELHWSHLLLWWVLLLGHLTAAWNGQPLGAAIESAAVWSTVPLHLLLLLVVPLSIRKVLGWTAAGLLAVAMAAVYSYANLFFAGAPDHHGLVATALLCTMLYLATGGAGWVYGRETDGAPDLPLARRYYALAGLCTGTGLWISAATAIPILIGMGAGVVAAGFFLLGRLREGEALYRPELWRLWGGVAAVASLAFYALEYFPGHLALRLEVNHPLYALALAAAGELLFRVTRWQSERGRICRSGGEWLLAALTLLALVAVPVTIALGGSAVFVVRDPFLWTLHKDYIHEFASYGTWWKRQSTIARWVAISPLALQLVVVIQLVASREVERWRKSAVLLPCLAALSVSGLGLLQVRWMQTSDGIWLALLPVLTAAILARQRVRSWHWAEKGFAGVFLLLVCIQMPQATVRDAYDAWVHPPSPSVEEKSTIFVRDVAYRIRALAGKQVPVVAAGPTMTSWMMYYGGVRGLGTLYWENLAGLKAGATLYAARDDETARRLILAKNVSFIAMLSVEPFALEYPRLIRGLSFGAEAQDTLAWRMKEYQELPIWMKEVMVPIPGDFAPSWARVYDVRAVLRKRQMPQ